MLKKLKSFICNIFNIKACKCDEHITMYTEVPESDVPVHNEPCPRHRYHKNKMSYVPGRINIEEKYARNGKKR